MMIFMAPRLIQVCMRSLHISKFISLTTAGLDTAGLDTAARLLHNGKAVTYLGIQQRGWSICKLINLNSNNLTSYQVLLTT